MAAEPVPNTDDSLFVPRRDTTGYDGRTSSRAGSWMSPPPPTTASSVPAVKAARHRRTTAEASIRSYRATHDRDDDDAGADRRAAGAHQGRAPEGESAGQQCPRAAPLRAGVRGRRADGSLLPGPAGVPAHGDVREPRLQGLDALLLRHRQREPAGLLRLPGPRSRS